MVSNPVFGISGKSNGEREWTHVAGEDEERSESYGYGTNTLERSQTGRTDYQLQDFRYDLH